eukprot:4707668-Amphidinium_carterae.1
MTFDHKKLGRLRLIQSVVHSSLWLVVTQKTWEKYQSKKKTTVRILETSTVIGDQTATLFDMEFDTPLGLLAVYVDDLLCAANTDVIHAIQTSVDIQWKTGAFQILGTEGCDEIVYLGTRLVWVQATVVERVAPAGPRLDKELVKPRLWQVTARTGRSFRSNSQPFQPHTRQRVCSAAAYD